MQVMSTLMLNTGVVHLPVFEPLRNDLVQALSVVARATNASTDDAGDYFNMTMASKVAIDQVAGDAVVIISLFLIEDCAIANASILAAGSTLYAWLLGQPQPRTALSYPR
jgi:hypothetical protein